MGYTPKFLLIGNVSAKLPQSVRNTQKKLRNDNMNPDVGVYQTTPDNNCILLVTSGSKTFSSVTEIWVWWTSCDPSLKQRMLTWQKCWLYGWFLAVG